MVFIGIPEILHLRPDLATGNWEAQKLPTGTYFGENMHGTRQANSSRKIGVRRLSLKAIAPRTTATNNIQKTPAGFEPMTGWC